MACGLPVAAYPVNSPIDVLGDSRAGVMHEDLPRFAQDRPQNGPRARRKAFMARRNRTVCQSLAGFTSVKDIRESPQVGGLVKN